MSVLVFVFKFSPAGFLGVLLQFYRLGVLLGCVMSRQRRRHGLFSFPKCGWHIRVWRDTTQLDGYPGPGHHRVGRVVKVHPDSCVVENRQGSWKVSYVARGACNMFKGYLPLPTRSLRAKCKLQREKFSEGVTARESGKFPIHMSHDMSYRIQMCHVRGTSLLNRAVYDPDTQYVHIHDGANDGAEEEMFFKVGLRVSGYTVIM